MLRYCRAHRHEHGYPGGWRRGRHGMGLGMRGGGRRRAFEQGDLRFVILKLVADAPRHGYDIIKAIEESFGGTYTPSPGVVYPTLTLLEDQGFATVTPGEGSRKLYAVTAEGRSFLDANKANVDALFARMDEVRRAFGGGLAPEIRRAVQNFRTAFELRLERGPLNAEEIAAIAKAIDTAAAEVERC